MYNKIAGGTKVMVDSNAGYSVPVYVPPFGYGFNWINGEIEKTDVIMSSRNTKQQVWQRTELPKNWLKDRAVEIERQKLNAEYINSDLEKFREQEWNRRFRGVWVYLNGVPTYITGSHYMYLNWWRLDDGYPNYRDCDRRRYYFEMYCIEDPRCAGMMEASNRRSGKSYRSSLFLFDYVSVTSDSMGGMQSKTGLDASNFFRGKLVTPFKRLPDFFQPEIDESSGSKMTKEIRFTKTNKRGRGASKDMSELGQNAFLNYKASEVYGYDGEKLHRYVADEVGKPSDADVYERHTVVKYCLRVGKKWIGKALYTTTPETIEGIDMDDYPFKKLWEESDFNKRDGNHHTDSGLYRYLIPADETLECDIYGMPLLKDNRIYIQHTRAAAKAKSYKKYLTEIKKNPLSVQEMFMPSLEKSGIYNTEKLAERLDYLQWNKNITTRGNLVWEGGIKDSKVVYQANKTGKFNFAWKPNEENANNVEKRGNIWLPKNKLQFICGLDPFDHDVNNDERRSNAAAYIFKKNNPTSTDDYNNAFVVEYINRPATAALMYEDILMLCVFFGCEVLYENQKPGIKRYFSERGYEKFLVKLPQYDDYGIPSTPANKQTLAEVTEDYIENYIERVFFPKLIQDWLMFDIKETQKYDAAMAAGWTLVGNMNTLIRKVVSELRPVTDYFRKRSM